VLVHSTAENTLLEGNHAVGPEDDGIEVDSSATTLIGNYAVHNFDLGIEAVVGVTDGDGNTASGKGNPAQWHELRLCVAAPPASRVGGALSRLAKALLLRRQGNSRSDDHRKRACAVCVTPPRFRFSHNPGVSGDSSFASAQDDRGSRHRC
jgi:parallel beta-helix repeat protein